MAVTQSLTVREVAGSIDVSANTSVVEIIWTSTQTGESWNGYEKLASYYVSINGGIQEQYQVYYTLPKNSTTTIVSERITVKHKEDGTGTVNVETWMDTGISAGVVELTKTLTLTTIPRATTLNSLSCDTKYFNGKMTYKYTPKSASYDNICKIDLVLFDGEEIGIKSISLGKQSVSQKTATVTLSEDELSIIYNKLPYNSKGILKFTLLTLTNEGYISYDQCKEITLYVPNISATQPTATMTLSPVSSMTAPFNSLYIKGRTKVDANFTNGEGKYGAEIRSYEMSVNGKTYKSPYTSEYLSTAGSVTVTGTVTDSRGLSRIYTHTITVLSYEAPQILPASGDVEVIAARCDLNGNFDDSGEYLKIKAKRNYSKVVSEDVQKNFCQIRYRYKPEGGEYTSWTTILAKDSESDEVDTAAMLNGNLQLTSSYTVQVGVIDDLGEESTVTIDIPTDKIYMDKAGSKRSLGIGKYAEDENTIDIAEDLTTKFRGKVDFASEEWVSLGLSDDVDDSDPNSRYGRHEGTGCYYRVCAGDKHIYVSFNCMFTYNGTALQINQDPIPEDIRPQRKVFAICATGGRAIARIYVNNDGNIIVDWIQQIATTVETTATTVYWIDGYIDYWV